MNHARYKRVLKITNMAIMYKILSMKVVSVRNQSEVTCCRKPKGQLRKLLISRFKLLNGFVKSDLLSIAQFFNSNRTWGHEMECSTNATKNVFFQQSCCHLKLLTKWVGICWNFLIRFNKIPNNCRLIFYQYCFSSSRSMLTISLSFLMKLITMVI